MPRLSLQVAAASIGAVLALLAGAGLGGYLRFGQDDLKTTMAGPRLLATGLN